MTSINIILEYTSFFSSEIFSIKKLNFIISILSYVMNKYKIYSYRIFILEILLLSLFPYIIDIKYSLFNSQYQKEE